MPQHGNKEAFGAPGIEPRWTHGNKNGVGTAYAASSRIWFTLFGGIVTEVYYPTVDRPQMRDLQYLVTDGKSFFHEEKRDLKTTVERISGHTLGFHCTNSDPDGRYSISKEVITDPHLPCVLQRTRLTGPNEKFLTTLKLFALCAPHHSGRWIRQHGLRHHCERLADTHGLQARRVARDDRHGPFCPDLLWLRGNERWLDGSA